LFLYLSDYISSLMIRFLPFVPLLLKTYFLTSRRIKPILFLAIHFSFQLGNSLNSLSLVHYVISNQLVPSDMISMLMLAAIVSIPVPPTRLVYPLVKVLALPLLFTMVYRLLAQVDAVGKVVILGLKNPLVALLTSSISLVSGKLPVELIETFCENKFGSIPKFNRISNVRMRFFIYWSY